MSKYMSKDERSLRQLAETLASDALELPESDLDEIIAKSGRAPSEVVFELRTRAEKALEQVRRERLESARRGYAAASPSSVAASARQRSRDEMLAMIERVMASPDTLPAALTLAARDGRTLSDLDLSSLMEDLETLGLLDDDDRS